jgi:hypothetical protein
MMEVSGEPLYGEEEQGLQHETYSADNVEERSYDHR